MNFEDLALGLRLTPIDAVFFNNKLYFIASEYNRLYSIDVDDGCIYEENDMCIGKPEKCLAGSLVQGNGTIFFTPRTSFELIEFDVSNSTNRKKVVPRQEICFGNSGSNFFSGIVKGTTLYLFCFSYFGILAYDIDRKEFRHLSDWIDPSRCYDSEDGCFHMSYYDEGDKVYIPFMNTNAVLEFEPSSESIKIHDVGDEKQRFISIQKIGDDFFLIPRDGSLGALVRWNPQNGKYKQYYGFPKGFAYEHYSFYRSIVVNNKLIMLAHAGNMNILFDPITEEMHAFKDLYDVSDVKVAKYSAMTRRGNDVFFLTPKGLGIWNTERDEVIHKPYKFSEDILKKYRREENDKQILNEYKRINLRQPLKEGIESDLYSYVRYIGNR